MIPRILHNAIQKQFFRGKAIVVLGPRQTGKTTLLSNLLAEQEQVLVLNCDEDLIRQSLEQGSLEQLKRIIGSASIVFIDEAQRVKNIGLVLKIIVDQLKQVQLIVSGSSALDLANQINEPLTGRKWEYQLYPISWKELEQHVGYLKAQQQLSARLVYGMYPDVFNYPGEEETVIKQLASSYLYKDLLGYNGIRKPDLLEKLLRALALQIGQEVSYNELSRLLEVDKKTIDQYIQLLEKAFVVFRLAPYSRNHRKEISSTRKIYFYDNGVRNAVIVNFQPLALRTDVGALWENFLMAERMKRNAYRGSIPASFFWRTTAQQEVDLLEEQQGRLQAFEFKWNAAKRVYFPKSFTAAYPDAEQQIIHPDNFSEWLQG